MSITITPAEHKAIRLGAGLTQEQLAKAIGCGRIIILRRENGDVPIVGIAATLMRYIKIYGPPEFALTSTGSMAVRVLRDALNRNPDADLEVRMADLYNIGVTTPPAFGFTDLGDGMARVRRVVLEDWIREHLETDVGQGYTDWRK